MSSKSQSRAGMPTALIVEDEPELRLEIRDLLRTLWPELTIAAEAQSGVEALRMLGEHRPDIVFLDIQIPDPNGLEVAREIGDRCHIVFITAYDAHAIEAFEKGAVDYLLKPVHADRMSLTVRRLQRRLAQVPLDVAPVVERIQPAQSGRHLRWITSNVGNAFKLVMTDDVVFFQSDNRYTRVALADSEVLITKTLKELLEELDPEQFWQIHRSTIVNASEISGIEPNMVGRLSVKLKSRRESLPVSETFMRRFRQM